MTPSTLLNQKLPERKVFYCDTMAGAHDGVCPPPVCADHTKEFCPYCIGYNKCIEDMERKIHVRVIVDGKEYKAVIE